ncbi:MAG: hydrogenase maturation protease [Cyanobacteria bacterium P01_D01_bin.2]
MLPSIQPSTQAPPQISTALDYEFLIIGYGHELCGDAAVGPWVATAVAKWNLPTVKAVAVPQLIPNLTADIAKAHYVIFVDACDQTRIRTVQITPIVPCDLPPLSMAFATYDPQALLCLTQRLHSRHPQAWLVNVPIESCALGSDLSSKAHKGCDHALRAIEQFLLTYRQPRGRAVDEI